MLIQGEKAHLQQRRLLLVAGTAIAVMLAAALGFMLAVDRQSRLDTSSAQILSRADTVAMAVQNRINRAAHHLADLTQHLSDGSSALPVAQARARVISILSTIESRELQDLTLVDDDGVRLAGERGDGNFYDWVPEGTRLGDAGVVMGPLQSRSDGQWQLPFAMAVTTDTWVLARIPASEFMDGVIDSTLGAGGVQLLVDDNGLVMSDSRGERLQGRPVPGGWPLKDADKSTDLLGDGVDRQLGVRSVGSAPITAVIGRATDDALNGWWRWLVAAVTVYGLYLCGLGYLLYMSKVSWRRQTQLTEELRQGSAELALAYQIGRVSTWTSNRLTLHWGNSAAKMYGVEETSASLDELFKRVHHDDLSLVRRAWERALTGEAPLDIEFRIVLPGKQVRWVSVRGERLDNDCGFMTGAVVDVTDRFEAQARAREAERQFRLLFDRNPLPIWLFDMQSMRFLEVNEAASDQYGYSRDEFMDMSILDIRLPEEHEEVKEAVALSMRGVVREPRERQHMRKDGSKLWVMAQTAQLEFGDHQACLVLAVDVTERKRYEDDLSYRATHHPDTDLMNRQGLADKLDVRERGFSIVHIQMRGIQMVAHTLGQAIGQQVLKTVAERLSVLGSRYGDLAFQPGEDFILAIKDRYDLDHVIEHLSEVVTEPVRGPESFHQLRAHIGVDVCADGAMPADQVMARAAQAAYAAREDGCLVKRYDGQVAERLTTRLHLAARIHTAIEQGEFQLFFQPICDARSGQPVLMEALLRWPQADGSWIAPSDFIGVAEETGQMVALGRWVIRAAARAQRQLASAGWPGLVVAVNVSAVQFYSDDLVGELVRACEDAGVEPTRLQVELTESSLMRDPERGLATMQRLHDRGISIALDDFGTGFSSMSYLQNLPLDTLKIDRSFVTLLETDTRSAAICSALLSLGHSLGLQIVAEGVETPAQQQWLIERGCDHLQGYLLGRPVAMEQTLEWLQAQSAPAF